jgi:hypothetical protein
MGERKEGIWARWKSTPETEFVSGGIDGEETASACDVKGSMRQRLVREALAWNVINTRFVVALLLDAAAVLLLLAASSVRPSSTV